MTRARHRLVSLLLLGLLAVPAAWGRPAPRKSPSPPQRPAFSLLDLIQVWLGFSSNTSWLKEGCKVDPFGRCLPQAATDGSCLIDPFGKCSENVTTDEGCRVDPNGHCSTGH